MTERSFPKIAGDILYASEVNDITNATSYALKPYYGYDKRLQYNAIFNNFDEDNLQTKTNLTIRYWGGGTAAKRGGAYTKGTTGDYVLESKSTIIDSDVSNVYGLIDYEIWTVYDECDDGSIDATKWTVTGTSLETTSGIYTSNNAVANGLIRSNDLSSYKVIFFKFGIGGSGGAGWSSNAQLYLADDTGHSVALLTADGSSSGGGQSYNGDCKIYLNWAAKTAQVEFYVNYVIPTQQEPIIYRFTQQHDLSAFVNTCKINMVASGDNQRPAGVNIYFLRFGKAAPTTTFNISLSVDGGSTYTSMQNGTLRNIAIAGSTLRIKATGTVASGEVIQFNQYTIIPYGF